MWRRGSLVGFKATKHLPGMEPSPFKPGDRLCPKCKQRRYARNLPRNRRRAETQVRRYARANRIHKLWTLTCAPADYTEDLAEWRRRIRRLQQGISRVLWPRFGKFAYVVVLERGEQSGRLHLHMGVPKFIDWQELARVWRWGSIQTPRLRTLRGWRLTVADCARYLQQYVSKAFGADDQAVSTHETGRHRYWLAQGYQPAAIRQAVPRLPDVALYLAGLFGAPPSFWGSSDHVTGWRAPPCHWFYWSGVTMRPLRRVA